MRAGDHYLRNETADGGPVSVQPATHWVDAFTPVTTRDSMPLIDSVLFGRIREEQTPMLEYSEAFLEQNERALDELLNLLTPAGQRAAKMLAEMDLEALQPEPAEATVAAGPGGA